MDPFSMGGWGKGLQGAGDALMQLASFYESRRRDKATRDEQSAAAKAAAEERARRQAEADRLYNQNLELKKFELGLEEAEPLERRLRGPGLVDAANAAPMDDPAGWRGKPLTFDRAPLEAMAVDAAKRLQGGRSMTMTDASGKATRYFQPREKTAEGKTELARDRFFQSLESQGYAPEQIQQLRTLYEAPEGLAKEVLSIVRPPEPETPWSKAGFENEKDYLDFKSREGAATRAPREERPQMELSPMVADRATRLRGQFEANPYVKAAATIASQLMVVEGAAEKPDAAGDLALIFGYMKILDPGSVVREGEFANAQNAAGVPDQVRNLYNRAKSGQRLNPSQRGQFLNTARDIAAQNRRLVQQQAARYAGIAAQYGVPPELVVYDPFDILDPVAPPAGAGKVGGPPTTSRY
jgi:hypothetical protein